ncbi:metallophosphoesterase [Akkermansiaceae bacterium]|nr:metallophosphoesterase [Akkermansiaceae bacterium]
MSSNAKLESFKRITRRSSIALMAAGIPGGIWAGGIEPNQLSITRRDLTLPNWPKALDGFQIAQVTDLHYRPGTDDKLLTKVITALKDESPDLITLTGDFVIKDSSSLPELFRELKALSAPEGIFASPGNHDRWHCSPSQLKTVIEKSGVGYLSNSGTTLSIKGENIYLAGIDSIWGGVPDPAKTWKGHRKSDPVIALVHEPDAFDNLRENRRLDLQLSGHTHGGQCRVPLIGYAPAKVKYGKNYIYGHFQKDQSQLWVGRGIGTVGLRVRFACAPELVLLTLRSA